MWDGDLHTLFRSARFADIIRQVTPFARTDSTAIAGGMSTITACAFFCHAAPVICTSLAAPYPLMLLTCPNITDDANSWGLSVNQLMPDFFFGPIFQSRKMCLRDQFKHTCDYLTTQLNIILYWWRGDR